jgi:hypothetical protein
MNLPRDWVPVAACAAKKHRDHRLAQVNIMNAPQGQGGTCARKTFCTLGWPHDNEQLTEAWRSSKSIHE